MFLGMLATFAEVKMLILLLFKIEYSSSQFSLKSRQTEFESPDLSLLLFISLFYAIFNPVLIVCPGESLYFSSVPTLKHFNHILKS